jgi:hypothetical protein
MDEKSAVVLVAANRPDYFQKSLTSIIDTLGDRQLIISLDFVDPTSQSAQESIAQKLAPDAAIIKHNKNLGCGLHMIFARDNAMIDRRFERAFIMEDDLIVSPGYFDMCESILNWGLNNYNNIGVVQGWNENMLTHAQKNNVYNQVENTECHWWGYLMTRECWMSIKNLAMNEYKMYLSSLPKYGMRDSRMINGWARSMLDKKDMSPKAGGFPRNQAEYNRVTKAGEIRYSGQDSITQLGMFLADKMKIAPVAGRGQYIGERGIHFNPGIFKAMGLDKLTLYSHPSDSSNKDWIEKK